MAHNTGVHTKNHEEHKMYMYRLLDCMYSYYLIIERYFVIEYYDAQLDV